MDEVQRQVDAAVLATLRANIEDLSDGAVMWSRSAYTSRRTTHRAFVNGVEVTEAGERRDYAQADLATLADMQFTVVKAYRQMFTGPVGLVWRCEPEVHREGGILRLYTRLCFEPVIECISPGIWLEERAKDRLRNVV